MNETSWSNGHARVKHRKVMNKEVEYEHKINKFGFRTHPTGEEIIRRSKKSKVFTLEKNLKDELMFFTYQDFYSRYVEPSTWKDAGLIKMKNYFDSLTVNKSNFEKLYADISIAWE
jgi:hypothetical protein